MKEPTTKLPEPIHHCLVLAKDFSKVAGVEVVSMQYVIDGVESVVRASDGQRYAITVRPDPLESLSVEDEATVKSVMAGDLFEMVNQLIYRCGIEKAHDILTKQLRNIDD